MVKKQRAKFPNVSDLHKFCIFCGRLKLGMIVMVLTGLVCGGCVTKQLSYKTYVKILPDKIPHQYIVNFKITETGPDRKENILSAPTIHIIAGQEAEIKVFRGKESDGIFCKALVKESGDSVEALISVTLKAKDKETLNTTQNIIVMK